MNSNRNSRGFTILELLVATTILAMLLALVFATISQASGLWRRSMDKIEAFKEARLAFDTITRNLSQATLNTYLDYDDATNARRYLRKSELTFVSGLAGDEGLPGTKNTGSAVFFQAPMGYTDNTNYSGMESLLTTCGYFVSFSTNSSLPAHVTGTGKNPYRYRLMQMLLPADSNVVYDASATISKTNAWFALSSVNRAKPLADNVIALIVQPQDPGGATNASPNDKYAYNSDLNATDNPQPITAKQLPPLVQITMVVIDEASAKRLDSGSSPPSAIETALAAKFTDPANFQDDMKAFTESLGNSRINYRVFSSAVPIRESKWTK